MRRNNLLSLTFTVLKKHIQSKKKHYSTTLAPMVKRVDKSKMFGFARPTYMTSIRAKILTKSLEKSAATDYSIFNAIDRIANAANGLF